MLINDSTLDKANCLPVTAVPVLTKAPSVCSVQPSGDGSKYRASLYQSSVHRFYFHFLICFLRVRYMRQF